MRALVTGITGFAGSHLAEHLLVEGDRVLGVVHAAHHRPPAGPCESVPLVTWDLGAGAPPPDAYERIATFAPDCIYHLAALSVPAECGGDEPSALAAAVNVEGTRRVVDLAARLPRPPRLLFTSSSHVYAPVPAEQCRVDEGSAVAPRTAYGKTKLAAERLLLAASAQQAADVLIARSFQHAGPRQRPELMLAQWARQFALGGSSPVEVFTRDAWIDISDVRDVVRAYRLLVAHGRRGGIYNVGSGVNRSTGDILEALRRLADPRRPIVETRAGRKQDPIAEVGRLRSATGWQPRILLEQTVADTLADWRQRLGAITTSGK